MLSCTHNYNLITMNTIPHAHKRKSFIQKSFLCLLSSLILLSGCATKTVSTPEQKIKIGVVGPLTGDAASYGENNQAGVQLALQEYSGNNKFDLVFEDDHCDGKTASSVYQKLIGVDKVDLIIGPVCSAAAAVGLPLAVQANVPVIITGASASGLSSLGDNIFRIYPSDGLQGKFVANTFFQKMQKKNVAVIYLQDDWGQAIEKVFSEEYTKLGGNIVVKESMLSSEQDARGILTKVKNSTAEFIYLPASITNGLAVLKQMQELNIDLPVIGGDFFASEDFFTNPIAEGIMVSSGNIQNPDEFQQKIKEKTGLENVNILAPLGYDAMNLALQTFDAVGNDKEAIKNYLKNVSFERSVSTEKIEFDQNGDLKDAAFVINDIQNKQLIPRK